MARHTFAADIRGRTSNHIAPVVLANVATGPASARQALSTGANRETLLRLHATAGCYVVFGNSSVTATAANGFYLLGLDYVAVPEGATHIAVIQDTAAGVLSIAGASRPQS